MSTILIALIVGALGGTLAGTVAGWWAGRRQSAQPTTLDDLGLDPALDQQITEAARQWATHQGHPAAAPLVADKLRLIHAMSERRRRRWSR
jgi:H+/gluconate symporter-like permease